MASVAEEASSGPAGHLGLGRSLGCHPVQAHRWLQRVSPTGCPPVGPSTMREWISRYPLPCSAGAPAGRKDHFSVFGVGQLTRALGTLGMDALWEAVIAPP